MSKPMNVHAGAWHPPGTIVPPQTTVTPAAAATVPAAALHHQQHHTPLGRFPFSPSAVPPFVPGRGGLENGFNPLPLPAASTAAPVAATAAPVVAGPKIFTREAHALLRAGALVGGAVPPKEIVNAVPVVRHAKHAIPAHVAPSVPNQPAAGVAAPPSYNAAVQKPESSATTAAGDETAIDASSPAAIAPEQAPHAQGTQTQAASTVPATPAEHVEQQQPSSIPAVKSVPAPATSASDSASAPTAAAIKASTTSAAAPLSFAAIVAKDTKHLLPTLPSAATPSAPQTNPAAAAPAAGTATGSAAASSTSTAGMSYVERARLVAAQAKAAEAAKEAELAAKRAAAAPAAKPSDATTPHKPTAAGAPTIKTPPAAPKGPGHIPGAPPQSSSSTAKHPPAAVLLRKEPAKASSDKNNNGSAGKKGGAASDDSSTKDHIEYIVPITSTLDDDDDDDTLQFVSNIAVANFTVPVVSQSERDALALLKQRFLLSGGATPSFPAAATSASLTSVGTVLTTFAAQQLTPSKTSLQRHDADGDVRSGEEDSPCGDVQALRSKGNSPNNMADDDDDAGHKTATTSGEFATTAGLDGAAQNGGAEEIHAAEEPDLSSTLESLLSAVRTKEASIEDVAAAPNEGADKDSGSPSNDAAPEGGSAEASSGKPKTKLSANAPAYQPKFGVQGSMDMMAMAAMGVPPHIAQQYLAAAMAQQQQQTATVVPVKAEPDPVIVYEHDERIVAEIEAQLLSTRQSSAPLKTSSSVSAAAAAATTASASKTGAAATTKPTGTAPEKSAPTAAETDAENRRVWMHFEGGSDRAGGGVDFALVASQFRSLNAPSQIAILEQLKQMRQSRGGRRRGGVKHRAALERAAMREAMQRQQLQAQYEHLARVHREMHGGYSYQDDEETFDDEDADVQYTSYGHRVIPAHPRSASGPENHGDRRDNTHTSSERDRHPREDRDEERRSCSGSDDSQRFDDEMTFDELHHHDAIESQFHADPNPSSSAGGGLNVADMMVGGSRGGGGGGGGATTSMYFQSTGEDGNGDLASSALSFDVSSILDAFLKSAANVQPFDDMPTTSGPVVTLGDGEQIEIGSEQQHPSALAELLLDEPSTPVLAPCAPPDAIASPAVVEEEGEVALQEEALDDAVDRTTTPPPIAEGLLNDDFSKTPGSPESAAGAVAFTVGRDVFIEDE